MCIDLNCSRIAGNSNRDTANADGVIDASKEVGANKGVVMEDSDWRILTTPISAVMIPHMLS